jgi:hypothetical protein
MTPTTLVNEFSWRAPMKSTSLLAAVLAFATVAAAPASAQVVISEVLYKTSGVDTNVFVELKGPAGTPLAGFKLNGINGNGGVRFGDITLSGTIPADGFFVVTRTDADAALAAVADLQNDLADYQNGPDSIQLRDASDAVIDAVGYGTFGAGLTFAGEGSPAPDSGDDSSLSRNASSADTDDNAADFEISVPSPGTAPGGGGVDGSCAGSCGGASPDGSCFCDEGCAALGDCCADVCTQCTLDSCGTLCDTDADCAAGERCNFTTGECQPAVLGWSCSISFFGTDDGCDCGCGIVDPDCADASVASCEFCAGTGSCNDAGCPGNIDALDNATCASDDCIADDDCAADEACDETTGVCINITAWTCNDAFFASNDGCDCGCGLVDPDCATASAGSCEFCTNIGSCNEDGSTCPGNIDPANNSDCTDCTVDADCADGETCAADGTCVVSTAGSCAGACGAEGSDSCFCDEACFGFGDCCADVCTVCSAELDGCGGPTPDCTVDDDCTGTDVCTPSGTCVPAAATGYEVTVDSVDASGFPTVNMIVTVKDESGNFVDDLDVTNFLNLEDGAPMQDCTVALLSEGGSGAKADIVFVFDTTGSMGEEIEGLRTNTLAFADTLADSGIDFRLGLVGFGDTVLSTFGMTADANEFRGIVQSLVADGGGDEPENPLDAIRDATTLGLRPEAAKIFILVTDASFNTVETTMTQAVDLAQAADAQVFVVTSPGLNSLYDPLVSATNGAFFDILAPDFGSVLDDISEVITARYAVSCTTPRPVRDNTFRRIIVQVNDGPLGGEGTGEYFIGGGSLFVDPTFTVAAVDESFTVDIVASGITDLQNAHIALNFDPSFLSFVGATEGELLQRDDSAGGAVAPPLMLFDPRHDPDAGRVAVALARQSTEGTDGTGVIVTLEFQVTAASPLDINDAGDEDPTLTEDLVFQLGLNGVFLESSANREIEVVDVVNGDVDSTQGFLLGDFDLDGDIDIVDFNTLVTNFGSTTATLTGPTGGDIGPASGDAPNLLPAPDGIVDHRDLFVFTRMFNFFRFGT